MGIAPPSISLSRPTVVPTSRQAAIEQVSAIAAPATISCIRWVLNQFTLVKPFAFDLSLLNGGGKPFFLRYLFELINFRELLKLLWVVFTALPVIAAHLYLFDLRYRRDGVLPLHINLMVEGVEGLEDGKKARI